ncbi:hypothetical protein ElyMa_001038100 [Elysia marginata]|uniref:Uncharacterized protein n=1 Tax=Elysia marginata TaxID=1093978 RepID=A0AAV4HQ41_9GAST|nr:hypothetical protein ElyMa_001038100 [Elysia marginata]
MKLKKQNIRRADARQECSEVFTATVKFYVTRADENTTAMCIVTNQDFAAAPSALDVCYENLCARTKNIIVYSRPESPVCHLSGNLNSGAITSITLACSTDKVYPMARCIFYSRKNGGRSVKIAKVPEYNHTMMTLVRSTVYYRSQCSVNVTVEKLGEGMHTFQGYMFPARTGKKYLEAGASVTLDNNVTITSMIDNQANRLVIGVVLEVIVLIFLIVVLVIALLHGKVKLPEQEAYVKLSCV